jgi:hypothetical protein
VVVEGGCFVEKVFEAFHWNCPCGHYRMQG